MSGTVCVQKKETMAFQQIYQVQALANWCHLAELRNKWTTKIFPKSTKTRVFQDSIEIAQFYRVASQVRDGLNVCEPTQTCRNRTNLQKMGRPILNHLSGRMTWQVRKRHRFTHQEKGCWIAFTQEIYVKLDVECKIKCLRISGAVPGSSQPRPGLWWGTAKTSKHGERNAWCRGTLTVRLTEPSRRRKELAYRKIR